MKKYILVSIVIVIALLAQIGIINQDASYEHVIHSAKLPYFANANEVIEESELIVEVIKLSEEAIAYPLADGLTDHFTISNVEVKKIIKLMDGKDIKKGDILEILESEWVDLEAKKIHHLEGYTKMKSNKKYTLYLGYNQEVDNYYPVGLLYGKIPNDEKEEKFYGDHQNPKIVEVIKDLKKKNK